MVGDGLPVAVAEKLTVAPQRPGELFTVMFAGHVTVAGVQRTETVGEPPSGTPNELPVQFVFVLETVAQVNGEPAVLEGAVAAMLNSMLSPLFSLSSLAIAIAVMTCPERL